MVRTVLVGITGLVIGIIAFVAFRLVFVPVERPVHYHANFAIFVDGERLDLSSDEYMEDVAVCAQDEGAVLPAQRVHLHNNNPDVVHAHHRGVTWGHLLANLGFALGDEYLVTEDARILLEGEGKTLKFLLNGRPELSVYNQLIRSGDRLLISYGAEREEEALRSQFPAVASNAEEFNQRNDPPGCSGSGEPTLRERIRHALIG